MKDHERRTGKYVVRAGEKAGEGAYYFTKTDSTAGWTSLQIKAGAFVHLDDARTRARIVGGRPVRLKRTP